MDQLAVPLQWGGRIAAVVLAAFVALVVAEEGLPTQISEHEAALTLLVFVVAGANVLGWLWPILAACISLGGGLAFLWLALRAGGPLPSPVMLATLYLPGLLYVLAEAAGRGKRW